MKASPARLAILAWACASWLFITLYATFPGICRIGQHNNVGRHSWCNSAWEPFLWIDDRTGMVAATGLLLLMSNACLGEGSVFPVHASGLLSMVVCVLAWGTMDQPFEHKQLRYSSIIVGLISGRAGELYCGMLLLAVARRSCKANLDGVGYVDMVPFHRAVGWWCVAMITLHSLAFSVDYLLRGGLEYWLYACLPWVRNSSESMNTLGVVNFFGLIGWISALALAIFSLPCVRRRAYDKFYVVHILGSLGFIVCGSLHFLPWSWFSLPGAAFYAYDRLASRRSRARAQSVEARILLENGSSSITLLTWSAPPSCDLLPGHRWVSIKADAVAASEWHPFSMIQHLGKLHVMVKGLGDWSQSLCRLVSSSEAVNIKVEGPFGRAAITPGSGDRRLLLIAGGVGVAPYADMLCGLPAHGRTGWESITLLWAARHGEYTAMASACVDLAAMSRCARVLVFVTDREITPCVSDQLFVRRGSLGEGQQCSGVALGVKSLHLRAGFLLACLPAVASVWLVAWSFRPLLERVDPLSTDLVTFTIFKRVVPLLLACCLGVPVTGGLALSQALLRRTWRRTVSNTDDPDDLGQQLHSGAGRMEENRPSEVEVLFSKADLQEEMKKLAELGMLDVHVCGPNRMVDSVRQGARTLRKAGFDVHVDVHDPNL